MSKHDIDISFGFTADTKEIKTALSELQTSLRDIQKLPGNPNSLFDDKEIREASQAAMELEQHLSKAVNVDTGNLDLSRFSASLKASGTNLESYYKKLVAIGPEGQQAFYSLARAISVAETPTAKVNKQLDDLFENLKRTAKWQLSSSIIHGFMGALQKAYGYAENLNKSLNDIRIVTGKNTDQMAQFADQANKAARSLSTTTIDYTDAALTYFRQGKLKNFIK